ncbi:hypothetical protein [Arachidicoccus soli]|uniref:Conjugative transposon TraJ C-terminal domain-containing protein n=1 Tax=Arachidicoccus soli TaxID=2341117 RepID=A0A386HUK2_9BACT|nr:hypothetical protein [Arachidicoccus soli]AYD49034.1 hypothetical protein D6B99_16275 [Arachidicoccus soli]
MTFLINSLADVPNPFWDQWFMNLINGMSLQLGSGDFVGIAKQVAAILSLIYLSVKAYAMIVGEGRLDIMPLFRPFLITLVIVNFNLFADIVGGIGKAATTKEQTAFQANAQQMDGIQYTKDSLYDQLWIRVLDSTATIENSMTAGTNAVMDQQINSSYIGGSWNPVAWGNKQLAHATNAITSYITIYEQLLWAKLSMWLQKFIETICMAIFKGVAYCMFFIQMLLLHVLLILGPIAMAMSIVKPFRDSWVLWVQKYFAVSFYVAVALIVLNMGILIISYGIQQEISRMQQILEIPVSEAFLNAISHVDNFLGYLLTALFVVIGGILQVPKVCSWILGQGGEALEGFHNYGIATTKRATETVKGAVAGVGASLAGGA